MRILVQKFGGTSLSTTEARTRVIHHIRYALAEHFSLVVVVSAMGRKGEPYATDTLLSWIANNGNHLPSREKDMLLCCGEIISAATLCSLLNAEGISATALTGGQAGIVTNDQFGHALITSVQPQRIMKLLETKQVVIVAGFQAITAEGDLTTLGRGGSDTTAAALGAALQAEVVDIFTDVNGILTADPRFVADARQLTVVSYAEICNMAYHGAKVIHPRAVEIAMQANIPIRVRSTFSDEPGTLVTNVDYSLTKPDGVHERYVTGIAHVANISQIQVYTSEAQYDLQLKVFQLMARNQISVDFINVNPSGLVYTVFADDTEKAAALLEQMNCEPVVQTNCAKVSVIGGGMNGVPGIMAHIVEALTEQDIQIMQSSDSNTTIWVLVREADLSKALRALHDKFNLHLVY